MWVDSNVNSGVGCLETLIKVFLDVWNCFIFFVLAQMLGVLKRRLKPKRAGSEKDNNQNSRKNVHSKSEPIVPVDVARITPSQRQIHPLFEEKAQLLAYDDNINPKKPTPTPNLKRSPDDPLPNPLSQLPKKSPVEPILHSAPTHFHPPPGPVTTSTTPTSTYHPAPNICVEGGRIEFIKSPSEGSSLHASTLTASSRETFDKRMKQGTLSQQFPAVNQHKNVVVPVTRAQQTQADLGDFELAEEKCDIAKEFLEARIKELERLLEAEQKSGQRERLAVARLQRQLARREVIQRDVDRERRLRADTESRLRETASESERYRASLAGLQREFSRMEDTVRTMLQYKTRCELLNQEKVSLTAAYENRVHQYQNTITKLGQENESLRQQLRLLDATGTGEVQAALLERLRSLENENAHLSREAEFQRKQYERCLDDIANQVVRALLSQKGLREEIGNLQRRIKELENQNHALANILVHKLDNGGSTVALPPFENKLNEDNKAGWFPGMYSPSSNGGRSHATPESPITSLSTPTNTPNDEIRRRRRRLHFSDLGDKNILKTLSSFESLLLFPLQRPRSLNLHLQSSPMAVSAISTVSNKRCQHRRSKLNLVHMNKKADDEGNESPESGNRDEGYSTMSSDIQGPGETNELSRRELEDLKEASDETDVVTLDSNGGITSIVVVEDMSDPDIIFIPLNLSLAINPRHSYPPSKDFLPFQHVMRSFSDSHLYLKLTATSPNTPLSPSMLLVDVLDKNPLRRSKATASLLMKEDDILQDTDDTQSSNGSWCSGSWWDTEYVQQWLRLDDARLKQQQLQLEYDRTELEDWSMSLSCEDIAKSTDGDSCSRKVEVMTPGTLPSIRENDASELEEDANECAWNEASYMNLMVDTKPIENGNWPYENPDGRDKNSWNSTQSMASPGGSWSSMGTNNSEECCHSLNDCYFNDNSVEESKRSSAISDDAESTAVGTDFTRDFYRLVKFESTKSLASNSSKSVGNGDLNSLTRKQYAHDRELALQSVLNFIAEQQQYCHNREEEDTASQTYSRPPSQEISTEEQRKDCFNINMCNQKDCLCENLNDSGNKDKIFSENILKQLNENFNIRIERDEMNHKNNEQDQNAKNLRYNEDESNISEINESEDFPKDKSLQRTENFTKCLESSCENKENREGTSSILLTVNEEDETENLEVNTRDMSESFTSTISTPDTVIVSKRSEPSSPSKSFKRETGIPVSISKKIESSSKAELNKRSGIPKSKIKGTKIPVIANRKLELLSKPKKLEAESSIPLPVTKRQELQRKTPDEPSNVLILGDASAVSFHERATSKDVIDELNRMIRKGEEVTPGNNEGDMHPLDMACCCPTGWVHVERDIDFTDPKARANLLDVMLASSGSSGASGSSSDSGGDEPVDYTHLHRLHRFRRQRKASATREQLGVLRYPLTSARPTIIGRENFFVRYGDKEREAVASFDFLEDLSTTSISGCSSCDTLGSSANNQPKPNSAPGLELPSPEIDVATPITPTTPVTPSDDSDERTGGPVSFSDSCADSYSESTGSLEEQC